MAGVISNEGEINVLKRLVNQTLKVRLFKNDIIPSDGTVLGSFNQATFPGYAEKTINGGMSPPATDLDGKGSTTSGNCIWTRGVGAGSETIYGYYVVTSGGVLLWAQRRSTGGISIGVVPGQTYSVIPKYTMKPE